MYYVSLPVIFSKTVALGGRAAALPVSGRCPSLHAHTVAGVSAASLRRELLAPSLDTGVCGKLSVWLLAMENFLRRFKALIQSSSGTQPCILRWCVGANLRELSFFFAHF